MTHLEKISRRLEARPLHGPINSVEDIPPICTAVIRDLLVYRDKVGILGSYQKGTYRDDSDLDLAVPNLDSKIISIAKYLSQKHGVEIDLHELNHSKMFVVSSSSFS
jgi:predicted nucleotidyltransferase